MAAADLNLSRRALLGAAFAVPVLSIAETPALRAAEEPVPSPVGKSGQGSSFAVTKWDRALEAFRRAEAALASVAHSEDDDLYDRMLGRFNRALRGLVRVPATDFAAFSVKLDLAVDHEVATLAGGEACMAALKRDARRLASLRPS
ncbi:MAG TPA: hypothetical protein VEW25_07375 [Allosphingosinicella sp.]|nr:hypothetical protein [Allosphingosinicella sp.]